jgi:hypothetical protein
LIEVVPQLGDFSFQGLNPSSQGPQCPFGGGQRGIQQAWPQGAAQARIRAPRCRGSSRSRSAAGAVTRIALILVDRPGAAVGGRILGALEHPDHFHPLGTVPWALSLPLCRRSRPGQRPRRRWRRPCRGGAWWSDRVG